MTPSAQDVRQFFRLVFAAREVEPRQKVSQMAFHEFGCLCRPTCLDRVDQRVMGLALAGGFAPFPVERDDKRGVGDKIAYEAGQYGMIRDLRDPHVKARGKHDRVAVTASMKCCMFLLQMAP